MKTKKKKDARSIFFYNTLISNVFIFFVVLITVVSVLINNAYNMVRDARLEVLEKQALTNQKINRTLKFLTEDIYHNLENNNWTFQTHDYQDFEKRVEANISEKAKLLNKLELYPSVILIMRDGYTFSTGTITGNEIRNIQSSYWYISNMSNPKEDFWTSIYNFSYDNFNTDIAYGKSILDEDGNYQGIMMISLTTDYLGESPDTSAENGTVRYILDENGIAIVHSISSLLGSGLYYMPYFEKIFVPNSSTLLKKNSKMVLHTNYYDAETGWTIVEEKDINILFNEFTNIIGVGFVLLFFSIIFSVIVSFLLAQKISRPIVTMATQMIASKDGKIDKIDLQKDYKEVIVLSNIYNMIVEKMNQLIVKNKEEEKKKRQLELTFLQAQINPHFLHNTLFSIKCLIEMAKYEKADIMVTNLMKMLKIPISVSKEWITMKDEISYLQSYISLMQTRYEQRKIIMNVNIGEDAQEASIPRLMLQPIIENSIFHGFDDEAQTAIINLDAKIIDTRLIIRVIDNGKGMGKEELDNLWNASQKNSEVFNRIGLANIQQRIKLLYGEPYGMAVMSKEGEGTETIITLKYITEEEINGQDNGG